MLEERLRNQLNHSEKVLFIIREYSIAKVWQMVIFAVMYFGWVFLLFPLLRNGVVGALVFVLGIVSITVLVGRAFLLWYWDVAIVTDERLIDIEQSGLFRKRVQTVEWSIIRDVNYHQSGVWPTLWNYATIMVALRDGEVIELQHVAQPKRLTEKLGQYAKTYQSQSDE